MRRWLLVLLLVLLPLQMVWAAAAGYCHHGQGAGASHVGHHDHAAHGHGAAEPGRADADRDAPPAADADCGHCHGQCLGVLAWVEAPRLDHPAGVQRPAGPRPHMALAASPPERPQWPALA